MMKRNMYGYIRVSSKDQHVDRQKIALTEYGIPERDLFTDKQSGKDFERPQYKKMLRRIKAGDCVVVTSLDRLGRDYRETLEQWNLITHKKSADIIVLDMPLLNTREAPHNLTGRFLADIVLQIMSYVAETERHNIRRRQAEGIAAARAKGVKIGRPRKPVPENIREIAEMIGRKEISYREAAQKYHVNYSWLYKIIVSGKY